MAEPAAQVYAPASPTLWRIAAVFAAISSTSFGGGQKAIVRHQVVGTHGWMTDGEFMEGLEFAQVMPGPNILNLAIYCGQRARGVPGAIVAFAAVSLPVFVIVLCAGALYFRFIHNSFVHAALIGCAAGAVGLTFGNAVELSLDLRDDWFNFLLLAATSIAVSRFHAHLLWVLLIFGTAGIWRYRAKQARRAP